MDYCVYKFYTSQLAQHFRKVAQLPKKQKDIVKLAVAWMMSLQGPVNTLGAAVLLDEFGAYTGGNHMLFPENEELLRMLWDAKFEITPEAFELPYEYFMLSLPMAEFDGVKLRGCLVSLTSKKARPQLFEKFKKHNNIDHLYEMIVPETVPGSTRSLHLVTQAYDDQKARCSIPVELIPDCLESPDAIRDAVGGYDGVMAAELSDEERHLQYVLLKIVCSLAVYMRAFPELLVDGFPSAVKPREIKDRNFKASTGMIRMLPKKAVEHGSPKVHYRRWHFRTLAHERYKRDEEGRPRIVFVSDCIVGTEVKPQTVINK